MRLPNGCQFAALSQGFQSILADRLQHDEEWLPFLPLSLLQQVLVQERGDFIQGPFRSPIKPSADGLDCFQGAATDEDRDLPEEALFLGAQEIIAPGDGVAQGLLPGWGILCSTG